MKKYDDVVIGSGISGLTMSLFLALNGRKVLLLEKNPHIGGSIARFERRGLAFDVGFHFTGGLQRGGLLHNMLSLLGILELVPPIFFPEEGAGCVFLESENQRFDHPYGIERIKAKFKGYFPKEAPAIDKYFDMLQSVCERTPSLNLRTYTFAPPQLDEDFISLDEVLKGLTSNQRLRAVLSVYAMCYGVKPSEISFANHSRACIGLYESVAFVKQGGNGFIKAFETKFKGLDIEIRCGRYIEELANVNEHQVGSCILNTGEEVSAENFIFTIHPHEVLKVLPEKHLSKAFVNRVSSFEPSAGFFAAFATLDTACEDPGFDLPIVSIFPNNDVNKLLDPGYKGKPGLVLLKSMEHDGRSARRIIHILQPSFTEQVSAWKISKTGRRTKGYQAYKRDNVEKIKEHIFEIFPSYKEGLEVIEAGYVLTFRDYLNSPDGSAYGVKQKLGQFNLLGRLPLRNLYVAGQSSILPGIIGAMMSSIIVGRSVVGKSQYESFLSRQLCD